MKMTQAVTHQQTANNLSPERKGRITGSAVGAILGLSKFTTPEAMLRRMVRSYHGAETEFVGNIATDWGKKHEDTAIEAVKGFLGIEVEHAPFFALEIDGMMVGASPDGFTSDGGCLEVKCPFGSRNKKVSAIENLDSHPDYYAQMQWEMLCTLKEHTWYAVWTPKGIDACMVHRDSDWISDSMPTIKAFWNLFQETIASPELSLPHLESPKDEYIIRNDEEFEALAQEYRMLTEQQTIMDRKVDEAKKALLELCAGRNTKGDGLIIYSSTKKGNVDYSKVPQLKGVDLDQYRKASTVTWTVKVGT